jgi:hypothetical protein
MAGSGKIGIGGRVQIYDRKVTCDFASIAHNTTSTCCPILYRILFQTCRLAVEAQIKFACDVSQISKEFNAKGIHFLAFAAFPENDELCFPDPTSSSAGLAYKYRIRQEPTSVTVPL